MGTLLRDVGPLEAALGASKPPIRIWGLPRRACLLEHRLAVLARVAPPKGTVMRMTLLNPDCMDRLVRTAAADRYREAPLPAINTEREVLNDGYPLVL